MSGIQCPHCGVSSLDEEFCDECGKSLARAGELAVSERAPDSRAKSKWEPGMLPCETVLVTHALGDQTILCPDLIEQPIDAEARGNEVLLFFKSGDRVDLKSWIERRVRLELKTVLGVIRRIGAILSEVNRQGFILGSFDLSDFWLRDGEVESIRLRQTRPFLRVEQVVPGLETGDFTAPEVKNEVGDSISFASDVLPLGNLFVALLLGRTRMGNYAEMRYLAHQLPVLIPHWPVELHYWVGKSTHLYLEHRYPDVDEQLFALDQILGIWEQRMQREADGVCEFRKYAATHVGVGKQSRTEGAGPDNEDRHVFLHTEGSSRSLGLIADGISTCKYGSGAMAAQCVIDAAQEIWQERSQHLNSRAEIDQFFYDLVKAANERVVAEALACIPMDQEGDPVHPISSSDLMGTTLVAALFDGDTAYTVSIGDSRLYLMAPELGVNLLQPDDNLMNDLILRGRAWDEVMQAENRYSLTRHIGMADVTQRPIMPLPIRVEVKAFRMLDREMLLLCSDGLTDYLTPVGHRSDIWNPETELDRILYEETMQECSLQQLVDRLVREANRNGGGDNITVMVVQAVRNQPEDETNLTQGAEANGE